MANIVVVGFVDPLGPLGPVKRSISDVVCSAGVSGLTTALLLSRNPRYSVTIVAKHMPGDNDIEYTSPWAGANYLPSVVLLKSKQQL
jgi:hypothetical protein